MYLREYLELWMTIFFSKNTLPVDSKRRTTTSQPGRTKNICQQETIVRLQNVYSQIT